MSCIDCDNGPCYMNCGPWVPKGQRFVERVGNHTITEDTNGCYRVYVTAGECLGLHGTEKRARAAFAPEQDK